jgi:hypothetical protein
MNGAHQVLLMSWSTHQSRLIQTTRIFRHYLAVIHVCRIVCTLFHYEM